MSLVNPIAPQCTLLIFLLVVVVVVGGGGYYFFRIHVKGVIEYFCDAGGGAGHFVQLLIEFCQPTPGHKS